MISFYGKLSKKSGKLVPVNPKTEKQFTEFKSKIGEGTTIEVFMESINDNGLLSQLAKVHVMIRALANHIGEDPAIMKYLVKEKAGLCFTHRHSEKESLVCKSFGDCSYDELDLAIHAAIDIGQKVNLSLQ
ncbi:MAG TPA: hypothetical protein VGM30_10285 [Puia sp.]|jgi:hypothetical protein